MSVSVFLRPEMPPEGTDALFRYRDRQLTGFGSNGPWLEWYEVVRRTDCGAWIKDEGVDRFVLGISGQLGKRFAYEKIEWARESYLARKRRAVKILKARLFKQEAHIEWCMGNWGKR